MYRSYYSHSQEFRAVGRNASSLSDDLSGEYKVLQDLLVDDSQGPTHGPLLLHARGTGGLAEHTPLGDENDMAVGEFLFKFTGKSKIGISRVTFVYRQVNMTYLAWTLWKAFNWGTGTNTTIAFFPPRTSTSRAAEI